MKIQNELHLPQGLSHFMKALKATFKERDIDIRQAKDSKVLHLAAEAQNQPNWQTLSALMQNTSAVPTSDKEPAHLEPETDNERIGRNNLNDLLSNAERAQQTLLSDDLDEEGSLCFEDKLIPQAITRVEVTLALSENNILKVCVDPVSNEIIEAQMHYLPFGKKIIIPLTHDELSTIKEYIKTSVDQVMQQSNATSLEWS
jgi:hypothetical protein